VLAGEVVRLGQPELLHFHSGHRRQRPHRVESLPVHHDWAFCQPPLALPAQVAIQIPAPCDHVARVVLASWLEVEAARTSDRDFALQFSDHIDLPGISTDDYLHRNIHTPNGDLLGGIRFYRRDVNRPFVEVIAHGFESLDRLRDCVRAEWSEFGPISLRLCARPGRISGPGVLLDQHIYVARCGDLRQSASPVSLMPFADADAAIDMVRRRYAHMATHDPDLARNVSAESSVELHEWQRTGQLQAITVEGEAVGVLAVAPGTISRISQQPCAGILTWQPDDGATVELIGGFSPRLDVSTCASTA
jgi:hypothetical protein